MESFIKRIANVAAIIGVVYVAIQYYKNIDIDKKQTTLKTLEETAKQPLLTSLRRIKQEYWEASDKTAKQALTQENIFDADLVLNTYDQIAILYRNDALDKCIVKEIIGDELYDIIDTLSFFGYPIDNIKDLDCRLNRISCNQGKTRKTKCLIAYQHSMELPH
jgi:hypothetical protein